MNKQYSHLNRGGFFSFSKANEMLKMVYSVQQDKSFQKTALLLKMTYFLNKVLSKCCQNSDFAQNTRFVHAQEKEKALSLGLFYGCGGRT